MYARRVARNKRATRFFWCHCTLCAFFRFWWSQ